MSAGGTERKYWSVGWHADAAALATNAKCGRCAATNAHAAMLAIATPSSTVQHWWHSGCGHARWPGSPCCAQVVAPTVSLSMVPGRQPDIGPVCDSCLPGPPRRKLDGIGGTGMSSSHSAYRRLPTSPPGFRGRYAPRYGLRAPADSMRGTADRPWACRNSELALEDGVTARMLDEQPGGVRAVVSHQAVSRPAGIGGQRWWALPYRRLYRAERLNPVELAVADPA